MDSLNDVDGLTNLQNFADYMANSFDPQEQKVPIVMVPGFSGWGTPLFGAVNYWGGIENIPERLAEAGHTVIVTPIAPISSNWERACELYAQLVSPQFTIYDLEAKRFQDQPGFIDVDYGEKFPREHGYTRVARGRRAAILFTQNPEKWEDWVWNKDNPVHFICHSQGGNTVRYLLHLLECGSRGPDNTPTHSKYFDQKGRSNWANSVSTIGTPHRGTAFVDVLHDLLKTSTMSETTRLIGRLFATLSFNDPNDRTFDLQLDHWGIKRCNRGTSRKETFPEMRTRLESMIWQAEPGPVRKWMESNHNGFHDNSILGVNQLNEATIPTSSDVYYFSLSFSCVQEFPKDWPPWTLQALRCFPLTIVRFLTSIPIICNIAQSIQGLLNAIPFVGGMIPNIPTLSAQFAESIFRLILDNISDVGGRYIISTLVDLRDVVKWLVNSAINPFLEQIGYNIRIPEPGDYLPITSVFPLMFPAVYALGGKNLNDDQKRILGAESVTWRLNDGVVNTESMKGPLNRNGDLAGNRKKELIADARGFPFGEVQIARGKYWHFGVTAGMDHADEIGIWIEEDTARATVKMYNNLVAIVSRLPRKDQFLDQVGQSGVDSSSPDEKMIPVADIDIETKSSTHMKTDPEDIAQGGDGSWPRDLPPYTREVTSYLLSEVIAHKLFSDRRERSDEIRDWISRIPQIIFLLFQMKTKLPAIAQAEGDRTELQEKIDMVRNAEDLVSDLEERLPAIARLVHNLSKIIQSELSFNKEKFSEMEMRYAKEGLQELRTTLGLISNTWDVRFFIDLDDLYDLLDDGIDAVLTVTGSSQDAFADISACYISWRWGRRGVDIMDWLSQFLSAARRSGTSTSYPLRIHGKDEDAEPVCIELHGRLNDESAAPWDKCNVAIRVQWIKGRTKEYYVLVADVASQLAWIVAAFKEPPEEGLSFSRAEIEYLSPTRGPPGNDEDRCSNFQVVHYNDLDQGLEKDDGSCWHQLFAGLNVAVGFPVPHRPDGMRGVELPFSVMTTLAGVGYPVAYGPGFVLKGRKNALFPVQTKPDSGTIGEASAVQWHLFRSKRPRLYMAEGEDREPSTLPIKTDRSPTEFLQEVEKPKRHFLGLYRDAVVCAGTDRTVATVTTARGPEFVEEKDQLWPIEWNRSLTVSVGGGMGGSGGVGTGFRFRKSKERQLRLTHDRDLERHLIDTGNNFTLLYNVQTRVAWMVPQICVVMHLLQAWAKATHPDAPIVYPVLENMKLESLKRTFESFRTQTAATEAHINLEHNFKEFSNLLDQLQDNNLLEPAAKDISLNPMRLAGGVKAPRKLAGVDFAKLVRKPKTYSILTANIRLQSSGDWPMVLRSNWQDWRADPQPYKVVTLFCANGNPQPIVPKYTFCSAWFPPPMDQDYLVTTMYCLKKLADTYGEDPVRLSRKHVWERGTYGPFEPCHGRGSNRLQKIIKGSGERGMSMRNVLSTASIHAAIVFGGHFEEQFNNRCNCVEPQQEPPPSEDT